MLCGVVWYSVVQCGVVWCVVVWCSPVCCGVVWCSVVWWEEEASLCLSGPPGHPDTCADPDYSQHSYFLVQNSAFFLNQFLH